MKDGVRITVLCILEETDAVVILHETVPPLNVQVERSIQCNWEGVAFDEVDKAGCKPPTGKHCTGNETAEQRLELTPGSMGASQSQSNLVLCGAKYFHGYCIELIAKERHARGRGHTLVTR